MKERVQLMTIKPSAISIVLKIMMPAYVNSSDVFHLHIGKLSRQILE